MEKTKELEKSNLSNDKEKEVIKGQEIKDINITKEMNTKVNNMKNKELNNVNLNDAKNKQLRNKTKTRVANVNDSKQNNETNLKAGNIKKNKQNNETNLKAGNIKKSKQNNETNLKAGNIKKSKQNNETNLKAGNIKKSKQNNEINLKLNDNKLKNDTKIKHNMVKSNNQKCETNINTNNIKNIESKNMNIRENISQNINFMDSEHAEEKIENNVQENKKDSLHKYTMAITIISIILFICLILFSTVFALTNRVSDKIVSGVSINGIDVSGLTYKEAEEKINKIYDEQIHKSIILKHNDYETSLSPEQIETKFGIKEVLDVAYGIGRSGKVLKDNYAIINANIKKLDFSPSFSYNEKALTDFITETSENLPEAVKQSAYYIEDNNLIINKGEQGSQIKKEELKNAILANITDLKQEANIIQMMVETKEPEAVDIEKIHTEIYKEAKDAYYTKNPFTIYPHVEGKDFAISQEEAKVLLNSEEHQIIIPLKTNMPNVTTNQIGTEAFPDLLATYKTTFSTRNGNRTTNIRLASNKINGVILMPGEEFSYNTIVGKRTAAAGYKTAAIYIGGKVENGIGGGICQVSSTLYNTALRANLEIIKRSNHRFATGYVPLSTDATVSWGGPEFIFKNSRKYPIKIVSTVTGGTIQVDIYGCKEDVEYEVVIQSQNLQTIPMQTEYRTNTLLPEGTTKTVQKGHPGYKSRAYRILKLNGEVVSKELLSTDTYAQLSTIIEKN